MSNFFAKLQTQDRAKRKKVTEKLQGRDTLNMTDPALHWGTGGWQRARCNLVYGPSGSGKTALVLEAAGREQEELGGWVVIFDSEYFWAPPNEVNESTGEYTEAALRTRKRLLQARIDPDKTYIRQSNRADELFEPLAEFEAQLKKDDLQIAAIIMDSWGGVQDEHAANKIIDKEIVDVGNKFGGNAKTIGPIVQTFLRLAAEHGITTFFVQHCIQNMNAKDPERWVLVGGQKLRYECHMILFVETVKAKDASLMSDGGISATHDESNGRVGKKIRFRCEKTRRLVEGRKGEFWFNFENLEFALPEVSLFNLATNLGVIGHPKSPVLEDAGPNKGKQKLDKSNQPMYKENALWWEFPAGAATPVKFNGQTGTIGALKTDNQLFTRVREACMTTNKLSALKVDEMVGFEGVEDDTAKT